MSKAPKVLVVTPPGPTFNRVYSLATTAVMEAGAIAPSIDPQARLWDAVSFQSLSLVVADITTSHHDVLNAIGFAQGKGKPVVVLAQSTPDLPVLLMPALRTIVYGHLGDDDFIRTLTSAVRAALAEPTEGIIRAAQEQANRRGVFISYSHSDREHLDRLLVHLRPLEREGLLTAWADTHLRAGDRWRTEIERALATAAAAVLLVSADFLASDFIIGNELPPLLRNAEEKGTRIIPVVVKPCRFARDSNLKHFQAINDPKDALILLSVGQQETYYDRIAAEVERVLIRQAALK